MSWLKRLYHSLRAAKHEEDLDCELRFHLEMRERERMAQGATAEEARRQAVERFGNVLRTKEDCREQSRLPWLDAAAQDLRYACRNITKDLRFTLAATACLAIGIGANTAVFSFVNAFLFQPLPPGVVLVRRASGTPISYAEYSDWRRHNPVFEDVFGYSPGERLEIGREEGERALGETVSGNYFASLGVVPFVGRLLTAADDSQPVAVISHEFWKRRFSGDAAVTGKTIWIDREAYTVAGVAAPGFPGMLTPWATDVWVSSYRHREHLQDRRVGWMMVGARLRTAVTVRQAEAAMKSLDGELERHSGAGQGTQQSRRDPLIVVRDSGLSGSPVWNVFLAASALVTILAGIIFVIACANVAGLLMARALTRRREILIRLSLGATRGRVVRQLLTESGLLALFGALAGVAAAMVAGDAVAGLLPESISGGFRFQHGIDGNVLGYTLVLAVCSVLVSGLTPALRASRVDLASAGRTKLASGGRTPRLRQLLVVTQVAASVLVLATAAMFLRSFQKSQRAEPGFEAARLLAVDVSLRRQGASHIEAFDQLRSSVAGLPGVVSASLANVFPLGNTRVMQVSGLGETATATVDANYFRTMGIPLLRGREARPGESNVAIVNDAFANRLWPGQDPVGRVIRFEGSQPPVEVIGLTATGKYWSLSEPARPFLYRHTSSWTERRASLVVRTRAEPQIVAAAVEKEVRRLNQHLSSGPVLTAGQRLHQWLEPQRSAAVLSGLLGATALLLAITGLYALLAETVTQRTADIAIRVALGAPRVAVAGMLLRHSALLLFAGTAAGMLAAFAVTRLLAALTGQLILLDAATAIGVAALLAGAGSLATLAPAYRTMRVDPMQALRTE